MAKQVITRTIDDIDGSPDANETTFGLDGAMYTIDLSDKNRAALEEVLKPFRDKARRTKVGKPAKRANSNGTDPQKRRAVREWANENGVTLADRGHIPEAVFSAYEQAQQSPEEPKRGRKRRKDE